LVSTYLQCFDEDLKKRNSREKEPPFDILSIESFFKSANQPTFRYAPFLKMFRNKNVYEAISYWIQYLPNPTNDFDELPEIILCEFFQFLWNGSPVI